LNSFAFEIGDVPWFQRSSNLYSANATQWECNHIDSFCEGWEKPVLLSTNFNPLAYAFAALTVDSTEVPQVYGMGFWSAKQFRLNENPYVLNGLHAALVLQQLCFTSNSMADDLQLLCMSCSPISCDCPRPFPEDHSLGFCRVSLDLIEAAGGTRPKVDCDWCFRDPCLCHADSAPPEHVLFCDNPVDCSYHACPNFVQFCPINYDSTAHDVALHKSHFPYDPDPPRVSLASCLYPLSGVDEVWYSSSSLRVP